VIYTIGHSTRHLEEFIALLEAHGVRQLVDIRSVPRSRRHPHFSSDALSVSLRDRAIIYRHSPALGGMRKPRPDSRNTAWRVQGFRGYADYMETDGFRAALEELVAFAGEAPTAIMCAEAVWWRCHRQLVADALVARRIEVRHIMALPSGRLSPSGPPGSTEPTGAAAHTLTDFAQVADRVVTYRSLI
jgi:uncharacterized protein (DUF488 family)